MDSNGAVIKLDAAVQRAIETNEPTLCFAAIGDYLSLIVSDEALVASLDSNLAKATTNDAAYYWEQLYDFWFYYRKYLGVLIQPAELRQHQAHDLLNDWRRKDEDISAIFVSNDDSNNHYFQHANYQKILTGTHALLLQWLKLQGQPFEPQMTAIELIMPGAQLIVNVANGQQRIIGKLRTEMQPFLFMRYLFAHPNTVISKHTLKEVIDGFSENAKLSELARECGFSGPLKRCFFTTCTATAICFRPKFLATSEQVRIITQLTPSN